MVLNEAVMTPEAFADFYLYPTDAGGRKAPMGQGYRGACYTEKDTSPGGWTVFIDVGETPLSPGEKRRVGISVLHDEGRKLILDVGRFYLWDGRFVGEATNITPQR